MSAYRNLLKVDADLYKQHLLRLGADSRYARFSGVMSDEAIVRYVDSIDWNWSRIIGYIDKGELRGAAEIRYEIKSFPSQAELAFSVESSYQNSRIGTNLMARSLLIVLFSGPNPRLQAGKASALALDTALSQRYRRGSPIACSAETGAAGRQSSLLIPTDKKAIAL